MQEIGIWLTVSVVKISVWSSYIINIYHRDLQLQLNHGIVVGSGGVVFDWCDFGFTHGKWNNSVYDENDPVGIKYTYILAFIYPHW